MQNRSIPTPTPEMIKAGCDAYFEAFGDVADNCPIEYESLISAIFAAMINAAPPKKEAARRPIPSVPFAR